MFKYSNFMFRIAITVINHFQRNKVKYKTTDHNKVTILVLKVWDCLLEPHGVNKRRRNEEDS